MTNHDANKLRHRGQRATTTGDEYRNLLHALVDQARADQSIAARLADEARHRVGTEAGGPTDTQ